MPDEALTVSPVYEDPSLADVSGPSDGAPTVTPSAGLAVSRKSAGHYRISGLSPATEYAVQWGRLQTKYLSLHPLPPKELVALRLTLGPQAVTIEAARSERDVDLQAVARRLSEVKLVLVRGMDEDTLKKQVEIRQTSDLANFTVVGEVDLKHASYEMRWIDRSLAKERIYGLFVVGAGFRSPEPTVITLAIAGPPATLAANPTQKHPNRIVAGRRNRALF